MSAVSPNVFFRQSVQTQVIIQVACPYVHCNPMSCLGRANNNHWPVTRWHTHECSITQCFVQIQLTNIDCKSDGNTFVIRLCDKVLQYVSSAIFFITRYIASTCNLQPEEVQLQNLDNSNTDDLNSLLTQTNFFFLYQGHTGIYPNNSNSSPTRTVFHFSSEFKLPRFYSSTVQN